MTKGKFIVFEGPDGSGQTTQLKMLAEKLSVLGYRVVTTAEPTHESKFSLQISEILSHKIKGTPKEIQELISKDRGEHLKNLILPAIEKGEIVISSRYFYSTFAYGLIDCDLDWLRSINSSFPSPDITFVLNVCPEVCIERIIRRGKSIQFFETYETLKKVMENYKKIAAMFSDIRVIDGERLPEEIHSEVLSLVEKVIK